MGKRRVLKTIFHLLAIAFLGWCFWMKIYQWIYAPGFAGIDTVQFIYYVSYYSRHLGLPPASWDHLWFAGVPRVLDMTFLHFYLIQPLVRMVGPWLAIKIYPMISFALFILFSYLVFFLLSQSILVALGLAMTVVFSRSLYGPLFDAGVVLSAISQAAFPMTLFFLVRFYQTEKRRNLYLAGIMSTLGIYSHGGVQLIFSVVPALIFLLLANRESRRLITSKTLTNAIIFGLIVFFTGAVGIWPQLGSFFEGGSYAQAPFGNPEVQQDTFKLMWELTDKGVFLALLASVLVALIFWKTEKPKKIILPLLAILFYYLLWLLTVFLGFNPIADFMFTTRTLWFFPITAGVVAATLLAPLSARSSSHGFKKGLQFVFQGIVKLIFVILVGFSLLTNIWGVRYESLKPAIRDINEDIREVLSYIVSFIGPQDISDANFRIRNHGGGINLLWGVLYDMPLVQGYFHYFTKEARLWQGWFYGVLSKHNFLTGEIPADMAKQQALFFIDWYGVKYFVVEPDFYESGIAPHFYEENDYISRKLVQTKSEFLAVAETATSGVVETAKVPVIGFIGNSQGYRVFLKDIAMLNLNTSYLIPVKISNLISDLSSEKLALVDALVIYDFKKSGLFYSQGWDKVLNFVKNGGKVWIESGGDSAERENPNLPLVFPISANQYGSLDKDWQPGGELASKIDFSSLEKLVYRDTPWQISYASSNAVKSGAKVLLTQKGYPVSVEQEVGEGKVLWTGVNLWYRPEEYRQNGMKEVELVRLFLEELLGGLPQKRVQTQVERSTPEHIKVTGQGFSGVVFKESYSSGWQAAVETNGKKEKLPILIAGPELMYVSIPKEMRGGEIKVTINYRGELLHWFAFLISLISVIVVIGLIFFGSILKRFVPGKITRNLRGRISSWWESEEE